MDQIKFNEYELAVKRTTKTTFYQTIFYERMSAVIKIRKVRLGPAADYLGENWKRSRAYLSKDQRTNLEQLSKDYGKNR